MASYIKDVLLENGMEYNADQTIKENRKQIFDSVVVERAFFHVIIT